MNDKLEKPKTGEEKQKNLKINKNETPEVLETKETNLDKFTEEIDPQIEASQVEILASANKILEAASASVGISTEKAELIYKSGGFAERIKNIKERIATLAKNTKEKISLKQLKFQGIENPERVLALAHYLEGVAVETESQHLKLEKTETEKIEKEAGKLRKQGYEVSVDENSWDENETKTTIRAHKETPYSFNAGQSKFLAKDLDEMIKLPNDPMLMFEALRDNGYKLDISKGWTFSYGDELKKLFQNPDALSFLAKIKTFGGSSVTHDFFKDSYDALNRISRLASDDATEHILTPEVEKNIEKTSTLLGEPISFKNLERWARVLQNNTMLEVLSLLKQTSERKNLDERDWVDKLEIIKDAGIENDIVTLLKDGFTEKSLGKLYGWGESNTEQATKNLHSANEAFRDNPKLHQLVRGASVIFNMEEPMNQENMQRFQQLIEKVPEAGPAFANLADMNIHVETWQGGEYLGNPERTAKYKEVLEAVAEPDFKIFADACQKAGYQFTMKDFFNDRPEYSRLISNYKDEVFRSAIQSEQGVELAKYLGILNVPANEWNGWALTSLSKIPNCKSMLIKLEENYAYKYDPNDDYGNYKLSSLAGTLKNPELCNKLFEPQTIEIVRRAESEFGIKFSLNNTEELIKISEDQDFRAALQNPETISFVKTGLKENNTDIKTVTVLAKCDATLRPFIERMIKDFEYEPRWTYDNNYNYDSEKGEYVRKSELVLADTSKFEQLRDDPKILEAQQRLELIGIRKNPLDEMYNLKMVSENNLFSIFEECKNSPKIQEFMWRNLGTAITMSKLSPEKVSVYLEIFQKIDDSPSQEIQRLKDSLLGQLLESEHPVEDYQKIESIFIKNNIPTVGKVYGVFETLHNPQNLEQKINQKTSPVLQQASTRKRYYTIYQDMLKIHIESGNRSMKEYAEVLQGGGKLIEQYEHSGLESLNPREQEQLRYFVGKLETLQAKSALDTADDAFKIADVANLTERINHVREGLKIPEGQTVLERISEMYLRPAGLKSLDELLDKMKKAKTSADERSKQMVESARSNSSNGEMMLEIKAGDFLKGVDARHIGNILQNGSVAKEFLGASSDSDATPLDTDISLVKPEDAEGGFTNSINTSIAKDYGEILFALKDRGQYQHTVTGETAHAEVDKLELFQTGVLGERHYGIRTGFPTTEIDFMIARENIISRPEELEKLYFEIAQNGYYLPVTNISGKVIFTPEMYEEYRKSFAGLEKFDAPVLNYHPTTADEHSYKRLSEIATAIPEDGKRVDQATQNIRNEIEQTLNVLGVKLRPEFDTSILGAELLDTGSTGRHTNTPGDFDFDFSLKLDAKDFPRATEFAQAIKETMTFTEDISHQEAGGYYQLRVKGVTSIGGKQLEKPLDIDIGFASKSDLSVYGSHDAIRDKLNYIKNHDGQQAYEQTIANVILTKQTLKEGHAYKKQEDGGFGGVGVENWILANGGNMEDAFRSFRDAAYENGQRLPYERFKEKYKILDPGTNIKFQSHDNFISVLKPTGYEAMLNTIENYFS